MNGIHRHRRTWLVVALGLLACTAVFALPGNAVAGSTDRPELPAGLRYTTQAKDPLPKPVVIREPASVSDNETLPMVLSSAALLVALGAAAYTVMSNNSTRGSPHPGAWPPTG